MKTHSTITKSGITLLLILLLTGWSNILKAQDAKVWTDKDDYAPGEIALFSGANWLPNERVDIYIYSFYHESNYELTAFADSNGNFSGIEFEIKDYHLGEEFNVLAMGFDSEYEANWSFTDGSVKFYAVGIPVLMDITVRYKSYVRISGNWQTHAGTISTLLDNTISAADTAIVRFSYPSTATYLGQTYILKDITILRGDNTIIPNTDHSGYVWNFTSVKQGIDVTGIYELECTPPSITSHPQSQTTTYGEGAISFTVAASGTSLDYQWQVSTQTGFVDISGENLATLNISQPTVEMSGTQYSVVVSNSCSITIATSTPAILTVNPKTVNITPTAGQSKVYGQNDPPFIYGNSEWVDNANISGALGRIAGENVNSYAFTLGSLSAGTNYNLVMVNPAATFEITPKPVTITPTDGQSKGYGQNDPLFNYGNSEWADNDNITGSLARLLGNDVGFYAYEIGTLSAGANYILELVDPAAKFEITPKALTITADDKSKVYNAAAFPIGNYTVSYDGFVDGEDQSILSGILAFAGNAIEAVNAGKYEITPEGLTSTNYAINFVDGELEIEPDRTANVVYTGDRLIATTSPTGATLSLKARITSTTVDLVGFTADFIIDETSYPASLEEIDSKTYIATLEELIPLGNNDISVQVTGNFESSDAVIVVVYQPNGDHITGGGYIVADEETQTGEVKANNGSHTNFGFNFKYNKNGKNIELQGQANLVVRSEGRTLQFKSTKAVSMGIYGTSAQFSADVEMRENDIVVAGYENLTLYATLEDLGKSGKEDKIGFTIWKGNELIYSSNWESSYTERILLGGGNLVIHKGGATVDDEINFVLKDENNLLMEKKISVYPNPFRERVNIQFIPATDERAVVSIYSITGALVETLFDGWVNEGEMYKLQFVPSQNNNQVLFYRIAIGNQIQSGRIIQQK
jgi:hypothetical protein